MQTVSDYFNRLVLGFGQGWNRFWYTPSDPYTLCVIRICVGLAALYMHLTYTWDVAVFFQDGGLLPADLVDRFNGPEGGFNPGVFSYLTYLHTPTELYVAHALGGLVLVLFTLGFYTRIFSVAALLVTLAYIHRGPFATTAVEPVLTMLQFYLCLGPCGAFLSFDRWLSQRRVPQESARVSETPVESKSYFATISLRLIQVHTCLIYLMSGLSKVAGPAMLAGVEQWFDPWAGGQAVWLLIASPESRLVDLTWLRSAPYVVQAWSHSIVIFELVFAILIWKPLARPLLLGMAVFMWGTYALITGIPMLSVVMLVANLSFISPKFLRSICQRTGSATDTAAATPTTEQPADSPAQVTTAS